MWLLATVLDRAALECYKENRLIEIFLVAINAITKHKAELEDEKGR